MNKTNKIMVLLINLYMVLKFVKEVNLIIIFLNNNRIKNSKNPQNFIMRLLKENNSKNKTIVNYAINLIIKFKIQL